MKKWEYLVRREDWTFDAGQWLNELGEQGWELVSVVQEMEGKGDFLRSVCLKFVLKREKQ